MNQRNEKRDTGLEPVMLSMVTDIIGITKNEGFKNNSKLPRDSKNEVYLREVSDTIEFRVHGNKDKNRPHEYQTESYGTLYNRTIGEILEHTFGGKSKHKKNGTTYAFDTEHLNKIAKGFNIRSRIKSSLVNGDDGDDTVKAYPPK